MWLNQTFRLTCVLQVLPPVVMSTVISHVWVQHSSAPTIKVGRHMATVKAIAWFPDHHGLLTSGLGFGRQLHSVLERGHRICMVCCCHWRELKNMFALIGVCTLLQRTCGA